MSATPLSFQDVIMKLHTFWADQGCVLWQPYNIQLGAGTGNPATLLRVLGPEPWRVAYVEPSIRPDDGRYGQNPNRMQMFYQYQVILKPDPGNPQELYLQSLEAIGINPREQDIRFVEDNWESPALGAWGLGWEVWLNGQEITQYTYFQQAGGINLEPVSVEITYGIERIVLALQGVDAVWDMIFTDMLKYKDVFLQSEIEHCKYYFELADVENLKTVYQIYEGEHKRTLAAGAVIPAYDYVLKCSHLFNVLDARGAIGVTERAGYFRSMRDMTRNIAKAYFQQREALEYPLQRITSWQPVSEKENLNISFTQANDPEDVLVEIGVEELPADDVDTAIAQLKELTPIMFQELRIDHQGIEVYGTPRRLVVYVKQVAPFQNTITREYKGPPVTLAFDDKGEPTRAATGFAKGKGVEVAQLVRKEADGGEYIFAYVEEKGQLSWLVLQSEFARLIGNIKFEKSMRWNQSGVAFSRPIRWIVGLYGNNRLPISYADIQSNKNTYGVRPQGSPEIYLPSGATSYFRVIEAQGIILNSEQRRQIILEDATILANEVGGHLALNEALLNEVTNLVECPTVFRGQFAEKFLELPSEVLVTVMKKHQRYFAVEDQQGHLMPYFIAVRNGDSEYLDNVIRGNEQVLVARFSDAEFFYKEDLTQHLETYLEKLKTLTFQEQLGSMYEKNNRVRDMVMPFADLMGAAEDVIPVAKRAAELAKADLGTQMVVEMTSLQGTMGRIYAEKSGELPEVANAIFQHWLPRSAGDILPTGAAGVLLALLDRLDSLVGLFSVGLAPTGSADPFALRRAALGIIEILLDQKHEIDLREAVNIVAKYQPVAAAEEHKKAVIDFIIGRFRVWIHEHYDYPHDVIEAVLGGQGYNPVRSLAGLAELNQWVNNEQWETILDSYARCVRIVRDKPTYELRPDQFTEPAEKELFQAFFTVSHRLHPLVHNVDRFVANFITMIPAITRFFEEIFIMDENQAKRENRLALLQRIADLAEGRADFSQLRGF